MEPTTEKHYVSSVVMKMLASEIQKAGGAAIIYGGKPPADAPVVPGHVISEAAAIMVSPGFTRDPEVLRITGDRLRALFYQLADKSILDSQNK